MFVGLFVRRIRRKTAVPTSTELDGRAYNETRKNFGADPDHGADEQTVFSLTSLSLLVLCESGWFSVGSSPGAKHVTLLFRAAQYIFLASISQCMHVQ